MENIKTKPVYKIAFSAIFIALGVVLSLIKVVPMPLGGSVTLLSMLPIVSISLFYGIYWGLAGAFVYSLIQFFLGITIDGLFGWGLTPVALIGTIFLDYIFAYTALGLAGLFRKFGYKGMCVGTALAVLLRGILHFISGVVIFAQFEQFVVFGKSFINRPVLYSFCYNAFYMVPELIFTTIGAILLLQLPQIKKLINTK